MTNPYYQDDYCTIYHGDCREILPQLPRVDLVLTDPPYPREFNHLYGDLAREANVVLKDGGYCFAYSGAVQKGRRSMKTRYEIWQQCQANWVDWVTSDKPYDEKDERILYDFHKQYFNGRINGNVIDIGGGGGLFREWHRGGMYVVRDPYPNKAQDVVLSKLYTKAQHKPCVWSEGMGEDIPYDYNTFDVCIISSALDHCLSPTEVLDEATRVLKPGGRLFIIQDVEPTSMSDVFKFKLHVLLRYARVAIKLLFTHPGILYKKIRYTAETHTQHIHSFERDGLVSMLERRGYTNITTERVPLHACLYAITGELCLNTQ